MSEKKGKKTQKVVTEYRRVKVHTPRQEISFAVTEDCNLNCSYCYLPKKNTGRKMSFDIARKAVDYFLRENSYFTAPALVIDFIGGEPLLEIELMDQITDYIKVKLYNMNHHWFNDYIISFTTNGTLYHKDSVQKFVKKNSNRLFPAISLDGIEAKHDNARKYRNGRGSYKDVVKNAKLILEQLPQTTIKATFGKGDIKYFKDSVIHFLELDFPLYSIYANVAYEDLWEEGDDLLFEKQLKELADYLINNDLVSSENYGHIFEKQIGKPYTEDQLSKHWCNAGHGLIVGVDGSFYPCIRFLEMSFKDKSCVRKIGDIQNGIDLDRLRPFRILTLRNCSPPECLQCDVATGCNMCSGHALAESKEGTIFSRPTFICKMHKARVRSNNYFWGKLYRKEKIKTPKVSYSRLLNTPGKRILNVLLSTNSPSVCSYEVPHSANDQKGKLISIENLKKYINLAKKERFYLNFIMPNHELDNVYRLLIERAKFQMTRPYRGEKIKIDLEDGEIFILEVGQSISSGFSCFNVILHLKKGLLNSLSNYVLHLFNLGVIRINVVKDDLYLWEEDTLKVYQEALTEIKVHLINFFSRGHQKIINLLTDRLFLDHMNNCNAGIEHLTLGPDGKVYLCPAFYFSDQPLATDNLNVPSEWLRLLKIENAPICQHCDAYHCQRCFFQNLKSTKEINVPGEKQCVISHIEREVSRQLQETLVEKGLIPFPNRYKITLLNYLDPFEISKVW